VQIHSLAKTDQPAGRPDVLARLLSPNGELAVLTDGSIPIRHLGHVELLQGKLRGNHYHKLRREFFYVIAGDCEFLFEDAINGFAEQALLRPGDLAVIEPGIAHAYLPLTGGHAVEFAAEAFDSADVYRHNIVKK
jgi:oxalate decarboxylase/phosphoglucose isomerase-like protein (cupin superfamily)